MNNTTVINKKASKIYIFLFYKRYFFVTVSVSSAVVVSLQIIIESARILAEYFPFLQLHVLGFHKQSFSNI